MKNTLLPLSDARPGCRYIIEYIQPASISAKILSSYGIMPGVKVLPLFESPLRDPFAYEIMGSVFALRSNDSCNIFVRELCD